MDFQTSVLDDDGQWITRSVNVNAVVREEELRANQLAEEPEPQPKYGILSRTLVESPIAHWILPVQFHDLEQRLVAFIGDHFLQLCELQNGTLHEIARKKDFGSRIRNAQVIGSRVETKEITDFEKIFLKQEDNEDSRLTNGMHNKQRGVPPQYLQLVLDTGVIVSLYLDHDDFVTSVYDTSSTLMYQPPDFGHLMTVDPSSNFCAIAWPRNIFAVFRLNRSLHGDNKEDTPMADGDSSQPTDASWQPLSSYRPRMVNGMIHAMHFLYPRPQDLSHVILLLIVIQNGQSRLITYDWLLEDDLDSVLAAEKHGHQLPPGFQAPKLIIPLTLGTSFIMVTQSGIACVKDVLIETGLIEECTTLEIPPPSDLHHGGLKPVWTAWARPHRLPQFSGRLDCVYVAREDGVVIYLESSDESVFESALEVGIFSNVGQAFTSVYDKFNDILVFGGDGGQGTIWEVPPRQTADLLSYIPNWTPAVDFTAVGQSSVRSGKDSQSHNAETDRLFGICGTGNSGSVVEFRYGYRASITSFFDYEGPLKGGWMLPAIIDGKSRDHHLLLSMPHGSAVLRFSSDLQEVSELDQSSSPYILDVPTLAAAVVGSESIVQITTISARLRSGMDVIERSSAELAGSSNATLVDAAIFGDHLLVANYTGANFHVHMLQAHAHALDILFTTPIEGEVTCLNVAKICGGTYALVGVFSNGEVRLVIMPVCSPSTVESSPNAVSIDLPKETYGDLGSLTSIACQAMGQYSYITIGTRNGRLVSIKLARLDDRPEIINQVIANDTVIVQSHGQESALVVCDSGCMLLQRRSHTGTDTNIDLQRIWVTDILDSSHPSPAVSFACSLPSTFTRSRHEQPLLFLGQDVVYFAALGPQVCNVPRLYTLYGTPHRVVYSQTLQCLIVAISINNTCALRFLDIDSGEDISHPTNKDGEAQEYISGLGDEGNKITDLCEWIVAKEGRMWRSILVTTSSGRLLVVMAERQQSPQQNGTGRTIKPRIRFWTRNKQRSSVGGPIHCVAGFDEGVIWSEGDRLFVHTLDEVEKRFRLGKELMLAAPITSLQVVQQHICLITTSRNSLEVIDLSPDVLRKTPDRVSEMADPVPRRTMHCTEIEMPPLKDPAEHEMLSESTMHLLACDQDHAIAGFAYDPQLAAKDMTSTVTRKPPGRVLFTAELDSSVRRFASARVRPRWLQSSSPTQRYVLGLGIDGSMQSFQVVPFRIWALFRFIQNMAYASRTMFPCETYKLPEDQGFDLYGTDPFEEMDAPGNVTHNEGHVDGDILRRCLETQALGELLGQRGVFLGFLTGLIEEARQEGYIDVTPEWDASEEETIEQAYRLIERYTRI